MVDTAEEHLINQLNAHPQTTWSKVKRTLAALSDELGFTTLLSSPADVYIILTHKVLRLVAFNGIALILIFYLKELQFSDKLIGYFMTITYIGDIISSFLFSITADEFGRKKVYVICSFMMVVTGVSFIFLENPYVLTTIAFMGVMTPGGGDVGPFRALEQSSFASVVPYEQLSDVYAWYSFLAHIFAAVGSLAFGILVTTADKSWGFSQLNCYKIAFIAFTIIAGILTTLACCLSAKIEYNHDASKDSDALIADVSQSNEPANSTLTSTDVVKQVELENETEDSDQTPLLQSSSQNKPQKSKSIWLPTLSRHSLMIVVKLSLLFGLDSLGSSLISKSWQSYYIKQKFHVTSSFLGTIFFVTGFISGFMALVSSSLCKRIGPIVTMVATHLPASLLIAFIPVPSSLKVTIAILVIRASTQAMDNPPKQVFLSSVVPPNERTSVVGWINFVKTISQMFGPSLAGLFLSWDRQWVSFVVAGAMKCFYDLGILGTFLHLNRYKYRSA